MNCLLPNGISLAGAGLRTVNSALAWVAFDNIEKQAERALEFDRCLVFSSNVYPTILHYVIPVTVSARRTWFEFSLLREGARVPSIWRGSDNVYCHGAGTWQVYHGDHKPDDAILDLPQWQALWSSDAGSREGDAAFIDPRFCRALSDSPGHDLGADLSRLGVPPRSGLAPVER